MTPADLGLPDGPWYQARVDPREGPVVEGGSFSQIIKSIKRDALDEAVLYISAYGPRDVLLFRPRIGGPVKVVIEVVIRRVENV